jgi:tetratricopeptide (TPR) repeat protein
MCPIHLERWDDVSLHGWVKRDDYDKLEGMLKKAIEVGEHNNDRAIELDLLVRKLRHKIIKAQIYIKQGRVEEALRELERATHVMEIK